MAQQPPAGTALTAAIDDAMMDAEMSMTTLAVRINMDEETLRSLMASGGSFRAFLVDEVIDIAGALGVHAPSLLDGRIVRV